MEKSGLMYRRMYETRHTFASWALAAGESPEWVARTLGHVNTSMIYKTYGRYIPNLTRHDGSAFERQFLDVNSLTIPEKCHTKPRKMKRPFRQSAKNLPDFRLEIGRCFFLLLFSYVLLSLSIVPHCSCGRFI